MDEIEKLKAEVERLKAELAERARKDAEHLHICGDPDFDNGMVRAERDRLQAELERLKVHRASCCADMEAENERLKAERIQYAREAIDYAKRLEAERDRLQAELHDARMKLARTREERDAAQAEVLEQREAFDLALKNPDFPKIAAEGEARLWQEISKHDHAERDRLQADCAVMREALNAYLDTCEAWGDVRQCECECCVPARAALAAEQPKEPPQASKWMTDAAEASKGALETIRLETFERTRERCIAAMLESHDEHAARFIQSLRALKFEP